MLLDTVNISLCLICTVKRDADAGDRWVTGCPALDIFSQGKSEEEAKVSLEQAIELWVEDCFERGTLDEALREAGFEKVHPATKLRPEDEHISVCPVPEGTSPAPDTFPVVVSIPAYQAAAFLAAV